MVNRLALVMCALLLVAVGLVISTRLIPHNPVALPTEDTIYTESNGPTIGALILAWGPPIDDFVDASDRDMVWRYAEVDVDTNRFSPFAHIWNVRFALQRVDTRWRGFTSTAR